MQIAEKVGRQNRVLEHIGSAHTPEDLAVLLETGRKKIYEGQGELDLGVVAELPHTLKEPKGIRRSKAGGEEESQAGFETPRLMEF